MIVEDPSVEKSLDILHLNIRSIRNKIDSLMYLVHDFDILCFTETHLDSNVLNENLFMEGFNNMFTKDRNCYRVGIMIFVSNFMMANHREDLESSDTEIIWIEIPQVKGILLLCCLLMFIHVYLYVFI